MAVPGRDWTWFIAFKVFETLFCYDPDLLIYSIELLDTYNVYFASPSLKKIISFQRHFSWFPVQRVRPPISQNQSTMKKYGKTRLTFIDYTFFFFIHRKFPPSAQINSTFKIPYLSTSFFYSSSNNMNFIPINIKANESK